MAPSCTVIIPAYNAETYIGEALASLQAQTVDNWRAVVVDDGSTDATLATAQSFRDSRISVIHQPNRGVCAARNRGIAAADSTYVLFLDADDRLKPQALARLMGALQRDRAIAAAYGEGSVIDEHGTPLHPGGRALFNKRPNGDVLSVLLQRNFILCGALCARMDCVREAGLFREDLRMHEDWEYWCRLAQTGPFRYVGMEPVLEYRRTSGSAVERSGAEVEASMRSVEAVFSNPVLQRRFSMRQLARMRRRSEASVYSFAASQHLKAGRLAGARGALWQSLLRQPWQPREAILLGLSSLAWLPAPVLSRIK